jgi:hypothetical protein
MVSGQHHASAYLLSEEEVHPPIDWTEQEAGWTPDMEGQLLLKFNITL